MKKLEMPKDYYSEKFDITIRPYVKAVDIVDIAENALLQDNTFEQEVCVAANVIGLCTDICVISNALLLKANMPETPIAVDASCCAGVTPESHNNALSAMRMCQIEIL